MTDPLENLRSSFEAAPYVSSLGVCVESIELDRVRLRVPYKDENSNPGGALHGGVPASTINIAGALAAWTGLEEKPGLDCGTIDLSVDYLAAAIHEDIVATAEVLRRGKEIVYSDVDVRNDAGKRIAKGLVTYRALDAGAVPAAAERQRRMQADPAPPPGDQVPKNARVFLSVPFIARFGMSVAYAKDGEAFMRMPFEGHMADRGGTVHEGAIAAFMDTAGAMASWSITGLDFTYKASTVGIHVSHHAPARPEELVAHAKTLRRNNEIFLNHVVISGAESGSVCAVGSVTYRIVIP